MITTLHGYGSRYSQSHNDEVKGLAARVHILDKDFKLTGRLKYIKCKDDKLVQVLAEISYNIVTYTYFWWIKTETISTETMWVYSDKFLYSFEDEIVETILECN